MSIGKSNKKIKEEISFGNEEFRGNNVVKWRKSKKNMEAKKIIHSYSTTLHSFFEEIKIVS